MGGEGWFGVRKSKAASDICHRQDLERPKAGLSNGKGPLHQPNIFNSCVAGSMLDTCHPNPRDGFLVLVTKLGISHTPGKHQRGHIWTETEQLCSKAGTPSVVLGSALAVTQMESSSDVSPQAPLVSANQASTGHCSWETSRGWGHVRTRP